MAMRQITPFVPCSDLQNQIRFYTQILGFTVGFSADNYAFLRCDHIAIRLVEVFKDIDLKAAERQGSFYIDVDDIDALYESIKDKLQTLDSDRVKAPFNQDYGQREFHVFDEDCTLVYFGQAIKAKL